MRTKYFFIALMGIFLAAVAPSIMAAQPLDDETDMTPAFGPQQYTRASSGTQTFTNSFSHCGTSPCEIVVFNGNPEGRDRIILASISINGEEVIRPIDFVFPGSRIVRPVLLADVNQLTVKLI